MRIVFRRGDLEGFRRLAMESEIEEAGLLVGRCLGEECRVERIFVAENIDRSPVRFTIDPYTMLRAYEYADAEGLEVIGVIHGHPAPPQPSSLDLENMRRWPVIWVIIDTRTGEVGAWLWRDSLIKVEYSIMD